MSRRRIVLLRLTKVVAQDILVDLSSPSDSFVT